MSRSLNTVAVFGLGKVGELVADLLVRAQFDVVGYDATPRDDLHFAAHVVDVADATAVRKALTDVDAVVSCLPYHLNIAVAEAAYDTGTHYFDLTEDVPTTNRVVELSRQRPESAFVPQCGLAPGLIGIVGASLAQGFEQIRNIELKVGAQ